MNENFDAFDAYVMKFDLSDKMIEFKYSHTYRTVHQAEEIARFLDLNENDKILASNIALLHDIARFKQWSEYKTYNDNRSFDHGEEAINILFKENEIKNYNINESNYEIIKTAIRLHNKYLIDYDELSSEEELHTKIIRDADKIDILYSFSTNRLIELENDDSDISDSVKEMFFSHKTIDNKILKTQNDRVIAKLALVFDLNFDYSKIRIKEEKYIEKMYESLKNKKLFKEYIDEIKKYLKDVK